MSLFLSKCIDAGLFVAWLFIMVGGGQFVYIRNIYIHLIRCYGMQVLKHHIHISQLKFKYI
jgi:hypothetical protein